MNASRHWLLFSLLAVLAVASPAATQQIAERAVAGCAANVIVPQSRSFRMAPGAGVQIADVDVSVSILQQTATTTVEIGITNPTAARQEAEVILPVPVGAAVKEFSFQGSAAEPTAKLLRRDEARRIYDAIVARVKDPGLLEFVGYDGIRSSVFPVEANGTQRVRLVYEQVLVADGPRVEYVIPRSASLSSGVPWKIALRIESTTPIATVYSPTHAVTKSRVSPNRIDIAAGGDQGLEPGPFSLSYLHEGDGVSASLLAYPDAGRDGGYFLLLAGLPTSAHIDAGEGIRREVTLVLDRSGSMKGKKIEQAKAAALQILEGLDDGESFNVVVYNDHITSLSETMLVKSPETLERARAFIAAFSAESGTNIHDALAEALRLEPLEGTLPLVLFVTDGLPTVGNTSETAIREVAMKANPYDRRIFTFGVGLDVNTPLLEKIAVETRAVSTFVLPGEHVESKVSRVFERLSGPILADPELVAVNTDGSTGLPRVDDVLPQRLPDLFQDDQLVLLGRYRRSDPIRFRISGNYVGAPREFEFTFDLSGASVRNSVVPRLWASRKIAVLVDAIRDLGADQATPVGLAAVASHSGTQELVDEIVRLSTQFGILTEYTAFLAEEGTDLADAEAVAAEANGNLVERAAGCRSGAGSVNQSCNSGFMRDQCVLNGGNWYLDANLNRVSVANVLQICDRTFYRRQGCWVDSRVVQNLDETEPVRTVEFGSPEFDALLTRLSGEGRQATVALEGEILLVVDGEPVLVKSPKKEEPETTPEASLEEGPATDTVKEDGC